MNGEEMPGLEVEDFYDSDSSDNDEKYSRLLSSVSQLDSTQRVKPAQRKEVASEVSEYNLSAGASDRKDLINVKELAQVLGKKTELGLISKKFKNVIQNSRTLPKPLEKPTEERLKRSIAFENVKKQLGRWDAIVARNALSDHLSFPLNDNSMKMQKSTEFLSQFKALTPLEEEMAKVLKEEDKKTEEEEEVGNEYPLTLEEMLEKRKEMAQIRAKLSYKQTKAQRQSKIKSKKYHRLLKRERLKQQLKEFEILQKSDPEAALKKLSELDKTRAQERASLRHRNTGQWAKNLAVKAKYDVETRKVLAEQLKISRDLTQKVSQLDSSDDEEAEEQPLEAKVQVQPPNPATPSPDNPWTLEVSKDVQEFASGYKKFWSERNKELAAEYSKEATTRANGDHCPEDEKVSLEAEKMAKSNEASQKSSEAKPSPKRSPKRAKASVSIYPASGVWVVTPVVEAAEWKNTSKRKADDIDTLFDDLNDKLVEKATKKADKIKRTITDLEKKREKKKKDSDVEFDLSLKSTKAVQRADIDAGLLEGDAEDNAESSCSPSAKAQANDGVSNAPAAIDPQNFIQIKAKRLRTYLPENVTGDEEALDDAEETQQKMMEEAFGDDDVVAEFEKMKREEEKSRRVEIETSLPGWGEWGGSGIVPKLKKKRLLVLNVPPRKDHKKKDVIINENENPNLKNHLVKEVPHPFTSVEAFEANIRAPVGRDWVPETAHQKLIQKSVVTKLGTVIDPMNESEIVRLKKASKSPYKGKTKKDAK